MSLKLKYRPDSDDGAAIWGEDGGESDDEFIRRLTAQYQEAKNTINDIKSW